MNRDDITRMARAAGFADGVAEIVGLEGFERFAALVAATERNKVAQWMIDHSYATGHGDTVEDLLGELEWQVREAEREACAKVTGEFAQKWWSIHCASNKHMETTRKAHDDFCALQAAIRARGNT
jgi:hypothetical protein